MDAAAALAPTKDASILILVTPGYYNEDVIIRHDAIHLAGVEGQGVVIINSLTYSNCTLASITAFDTTGNAALLVVDPGIATPPEMNELRNVEIERRTNPTTWVGLANASLRYLGYAAGGSQLGRNEIFSWHVTVRPVVAGANKKSIVGLQTEYISYEDSWVMGDVAFQQFSGVWWDLCAAIGAHSYSYDSTAAKPAGGNLGLNGRHSTFGGVTLAGRDPKIGVDYMKRCEFDSVVNNATNVASTSIFKDCYVDGVFTITNVGPLVTFKAGRYMNAVGGAGAAGFTAVPGFGS